MNAIRRTAFLIAATVTLAAILNGCAPSRASYASANDLAWLEGTYRSDDYDPAGVWINRHEETWSAPSGGVVVGMYHNTTPDGLRVAEILTIEDEPGGPVLRLRHFDRGLVPWESEVSGPLTRPLVESREGLAEFTDLDADWPQTFRYIGTLRGLTIELDGTRPDGAPARMSFQLDRVGSDAEPR